MRTSSYILVCGLLANCLQWPGTIAQRQSDEKNSSEDVDTVPNGECVDNITECSNSHEPVVFRGPLRDKRLVDVVWLVECPCTASEKVSSEHVERVGSSLVKWKQWSRDADGRCRDAILAYAPRKGVAVSPWSKSDELPFHLCERVCSSTETNSSSSTKYDSTALTFRLIYRILEGDAITVLDGTEQSLGLRPHADKHLISILAPWENPSSGGAEDARDTRNEIEELIMKLKVLVQPSTMALHFFLDRRSTAVEYIGNPRHAARYNDCTHFNKALTLKSMIAGGERESSNLQAHLLSAGVLIDVSDLADLSQDECIRNLNPILWSPFALESAMVDKCGGKSCPAKSFCSALHGCVFENQQRKGHQLNKAPLLGDISTSHADLAEASSKLNVAAAADKHIPLESLSILQEPSLESGFSLKDVVVGTPDELQWSPSKSFVQKAISLGKPLVIKNSVVTTWPAMNKWSMLYVSKNVGMEVLPAVKCTNSSLTFDPDVRAPLKLHLTLPYVTKDMPTDIFFRCIQQPHTDCQSEYIGHYYFGKVPETLSKDLLPDEFLYHTEQDHTARKQFIWISSPGMITHGHFDQDYNFFVQLIGEKRFTLWSPSQHELLYVFPRTHPLWHKSQVNFRTPDIRRFPGFAKSQALQVTVQPGEVLFIPPYTWHYVETLSPSVSLSTWSHDYQLYDHMNSIYGHDHKFDLLQNTTGQLYALRLYLDMMVHRLHGYNETGWFFARLLANRYSGLEHLFPPAPDDEKLCPDKIPTCIHVHGDASLDVSVIGSHFLALAPEVRDMLFQDYVEEITAQVVGVGRMLAFFRYCFLGQDYYVTEMDSDEHGLWEYSEIIPSDNEE